MKKAYFLTVIAMVFGLLYAAGQDGLEFSVENFGKNRTRISWQNHFGDGLIQVNVQVSYDSLRNFGTVFEPVSPALPENGYVDNKGYVGKLYYRIFYVLNGGAYYFTPSKSISEGEEEEGRKMVVSEKTITVRTSFNILAHLKPAEFAKFRDSISSSTKDTLLAVNPNEMVLKYFDHGDLNTFLGYIGLNQEGFVEIKLPDAKLKKYKVVFKDDGGNHLFTINKVADTDMILDKTDFLRAGWYSFELYQDDKIVGKSKLYLQSDF